MRKLRLNIARKRIHSEGTWQANIMLESNRIENEAEKPPKLDLLYLASNGRSGSTIFEMLLNTSPHFWTIGEFHVLPWEIRTNTKPCGCGLLVEECPVWAPIIQQHRPVFLQGSISRFRESYNTDHAIRWSELPTLLFGGAKFSSQRHLDIDAYGAENEIVLRSVADTAINKYQRRQMWIVDSSKSPYRLLWLAASNRFNLRVIHLVKDPRAFAFSMSKSTKGISRTLRVGRAAARWQIENRLIDRVLVNHLPRETWRRIKYEDLATDPQRIFAEVCQWLGIPKHDLDCGALRAENHGISGNPSRFEKGGIKLDQKWIDGLSPALQRLALISSAGLAAKYKYGAKGD